VLSRFVSSVVAASVAATSSAAGVIFDAEAGGGVSSIASITVLILCLFGPADFLAGEGSFFFCKSFVRYPPVDLA
jgi:hypothetical protein